MQTKQQEMKNYWTWNNERTIHVVMDVREEREPNGEGCCKWYKTKTESNKMISDTNLCL